jgi:hypothetical protein
MRRANVARALRRDAIRAPKARDDELPSKSFKDAWKPRASARRRISLMSWCAPDRRDDTDPNSPRRLEVMAKKKATRKKARRGKKATRRKARRRK